MVQPDYSGPANNEILYTSTEETVRCELDNVEPGIYWPILHVAGKGHGLVTDSAIVEVLPTYGPAHLHDSRGSLGGGSLLEIHTRGLSEDDITKVRVEIGNTPCHVQRIVEDQDRLYCITQPARDDGYSSLVHDLEPLAYWNLQVDYFTLDGRYVGSDGEMDYRNAGSLGSSADASVRGDVVGREVGISGNNLTNQAAFFNNSYLEVPFHSEFAQPTGFGMGLWLKVPVATENSNMDDDPMLSPQSGSGSGDDPMLSPQSGSGSGDDPMIFPQSGSGFASSGPPWASGEVDVSQGDRGPYHIVVDFASFSDGIARGYVIIINPCGQLEFWLASGHSIKTFSDSEDCPAISYSQCSPSPTACSGYSVVTMAMTYGDLPPGVWSVIRCGDCDLVEWSLLSFGWEAHNVDATDEECNELSPCVGQQVLHFNDVLVDTVTTTYLPVSGKSLVVGGTDRLHVGEFNDSLNLALTGFVGHVDEVSVFDRPTNSEIAAQHYVYGSTEKQKVWVRVESINGLSGTGQDIDVVKEWNGAFKEVELLDWNAASGNERDLAEGTALLFTWTRYAFCHLS